MHAGDQYTKPEEYIFLPYRVKGDNELDKEQEVAKTYMVSYVF